MRQCCYEHANVWLCHCFAHGLLTHTRAHTACPPASLFALTPGPQPCLVHTSQRLEDELKQSYATKNFTVKSGLLEIEKKYRHFIYSSHDVEVGCVGKRVLGECQARNLLA